MFFGPPASSGATTPQKTLQAFVSAINRRDRRAIEALVYKSKNNPALDAALNGGAQKPTIFSVRKITKIIQSASTRVTVQCILDAKLWGKMPMDPFLEQVDMVKVSEKWLVAAPKPDTKPELGNLASIAMFVTYPEVLERIQQLAKGDEARTRLRLMINEVVRYIDENNNKILLKSEDYVKVVYSLTKNSQLFTSPMDKPGTISFLFNANMTDHDISTMKNPESTVLFYEGKPDALAFRYAGKALVAFCDGRVRFVTPEESKKLLWK